MKISKSDRKKMIAEATQNKSAEYMDHCYLATGNLDELNTIMPGSDMFGEPELGNFSLTIANNEKILIIDRMYLSRRMKLTKENSVVLDEFGGDFSTDIFGDIASVIIPIGHQSQNIWPKKNYFEKIGSTGTDIGSIAFIPSSRFKGNIFDEDAFVWNCEPGTYNFLYEEVAVLGAWKQPRTRNIIVYKTT